ncbi:TorF family putative porin [soil metagenome]
MRFSMISLGALALASAATPAMAQDAPASAFTITGGATVVSDYRFRGLTQTDEKPAIQGTLNLNHSSGFYIGTWASSIDGGTDGSTPALTGYGAAEVDLYGGFTKSFSGATVDVGLLYYYYPDAVTGLNSDFFEPYGSVSYAVGPATVKAGFNYAWGGQAGLNFTATNDDSLYTDAEVSAGIVNTPITVKAHLGRSKGSLGLANLIATDDSYLDWSLSAEAAHGPVKIGVSWVDTDVVNKGSFANRLGRDGTILGYLSFSF